MASSARIDELRKKFDENPRRYFAPLANEYRKAGDLDQAILICQEYLPQQPGHMSGHIVYGQALYELARHDEAKAVFETALALDPENLIALKHLGDISRNAGDVKGAREWYQRVLEADPRNEEIAQIMLSLLSLPEGTPAIGIPVMPAHSTEGSEDDSFDGADDLLSADAAPPPPPRPPTPPTPRRRVVEEHELLDIEDFSIGGTPLGTSVVSDVASHAVSDVVSESNELGQPEIGSPAGDSMDFDRDGDDSLDVSLAESSDTPLDQLGFASAAEAAADAFVSDSPMAPDVASTDLEASSRSLSVADGDDGEPMIELADDIKIGLPDDGADGRSSAEAALDGLERFDDAVIADDNTAAATPLTTEAFLDLPDTQENDLATIESAAGVSASSAEAAAALASESTLESAIDAIGAIEAAIRDTPDAPGAMAQLDEAPTTPAFVTETMAELYLEQGHLESALMIYRTLVEQRPDDPALRDRMRNLEDRVLGTRAERATSTRARPTPAAGSGRPTIREFLSRLIATGEAIAFPPTWSTTPLDSDAVAPSLAGEHNADDEHSFDRATSGRGESHASTPMSNETVTGSIDALFSGAEAEEDVAPPTDAASVIAGAFSPEAEPPAESDQIPGVPSRRAENELSLDHVFKSNASPRPSGDAEGFSFAQFFAEEPKGGAGKTPPTGGASASGAPAGPPPEATDDIAHFNAWLDGLKKKT